MNCLVVEVLGCTNVEDFQTFASRFKDSCVEYWGLIFRVCTNKEKYISFLDTSNSAVHKVISSEIRADFEISRLTNFKII